MTTTRAPRARKNAPTARTATAGAATEVVNRYDAAGNGKRMAGWNPPQSGPNRAIVGLQKIRDRARDAERNDWSGRVATQKWTTSLIGIGIRPRLKRIKTRRASRRSTTCGTTSWNSATPTAC
jgi:hypothetical protein